MVAVRVGHEDMRNRVPGCGGEDSLEMRGVIRAGVNDGERPFANDVAVGPVKGERPWIARSYAPD
jgi:hypothetical protein